MDKKLTLAELKYSVLTVMAQKLDCLLASLQGNFLDILIKTVQLIVTDIQS